jgi:hypothetical protein
MSGGLELWLTIVEWRWLRSSRGGGGRGKKKASLLHDTPFIAGGGRGLGEGQGQANPVIVGGNRVGHWVAQSL